MKLAILLSITGLLASGVSSKACVVDLDSSKNISLHSSELISELQKIDQSYNQELNALHKRFGSVLDGQAITSQEAQQRVQFQELQQQLQESETKNTLTLLRNSLCH